MTSDPVPVPVILYRRRDTRKMSTRRCGVVCLQYPRAQTGRWHITLKFFPMKNPPLRCGLYQITLDGLVVVIITGRIQQISLVFFSTTYALLKTALNILYTHYAQFTLSTQQNCGASLCWQCKLGIKYFIRDYNTIVYGLMNYWPPICVGLAFNSTDGHEQPNISFEHECVKFWPKS